MLRIFFFSKYRVVLPLIQSSRFSLFSPSRLHPDQSNLHTHTHSHTHTHNSSSRRRRRTGARGCNNNFGQPVAAESTGKCFCKIKRNLMKNVETSYTCAVSVIGLQEKNLVLRRIQIFFIWFILPKRKIFGAFIGHEEEINNHPEYLPSTDRPMKDPPEQRTKCAVLLSVCLRVSCMCVYVWTITDLVLLVFSPSSLTFGYFFRQNFSTKKK